MPYLQRMSVSSLLILQLKLRITGPYRKFENVEYLFHKNIALYINQYVSLTS